MVYLSKIYTKSGDGGQTMLASGERVPKDHQRVRAYGDIDELNATVGLVRTEIAREPKQQGAEVFLAELDVQLARIQQELFNLGAELSYPEPEEPNEIPRLELAARHVETLEKHIDGWNAPLQPLKSFVLPGGGPIAAACHLSRTVCRRAEREIITLRTSGAQVSDVAVHYVNRLSDYFFVVSRAVTERLGYDEVLWAPEKT